MNLIERLRQGIDPADIPEAEHQMDAAADEIERLRAELADLQAEHQKVLRMLTGSRLSK